MKDEYYKEKIWYYPYIKHDLANESHMKILCWLREEFNHDDETLWKIDLIIGSYSHPSHKYALMNLFVFFKTAEMAMAFKLRWL